MADHTGDVYHDTSIEVLNFTNRTCFGPSGQQQGSFSLAQNEADLLSNFLQVGQVVRA